LALGPGEQGARILEVRSILKAAAAAGLETHPARLTEAMVGAWALAFILGLFILPRLLTINLEGVPEISQELDAVAGVAGWVEILGLAVGELAAMVALQALMHQDMAQAVVAVALMVPGALAGMDTSDSPSGVKTNGHHRSI
jgi:hypothetical protein